MRYAIVTETYPPEINGVALTVAMLASGLRDRGHAVQVARPRQPSGDLLEPGRAVMRLGTDAALRAPMRLAAREAVAGLRPETVAADFDALLQSLARGERHGHPAAA